MKFGEGENKPHLKKKIEKKKPLFGTAHWNGGNGPWFSLLQTHRSFSLFLCGNLSLLYPFWLHSSHFFSIRRWPFLHLLSIATNLYPLPLFLGLFAFRFYPVLRFSLSFFAYFRGPFSLISLIFHFPPPISTNFWWVNGDWAISGWSQGETVLWIT